MRVACGDATAWSASAQTELVAAEAAVAASGAAAQQRSPATVGKKRQRSVLAAAETAATETAAEGEAVTAAAETAGAEAAAATPLEAADMAEPTLLELQAAEQQALTAKQAAHAAVLAATSNCDEAKAASERAHALDLTRDCRGDSDDVQRQLAREHTERQRAVHAAMIVALDALVEAEDASASACWEYAVAMVRWLAERDSWRALLEEREADWEEEEAAELRDQNEDLRAEVRMLADALLCSASGDALTPATVNRA